MFGNGIPPNVFFTSGPFAGQTIGPFAASLDIAAHELTHGVVDSTSRLLGFGEPGALNEAFADIIGTSVEFFFRSERTTPPNYDIGEDSVRGARRGIRSLDNPALHSQIPGLPNADHYSRRYRGPLDDQGEHANAGIPGNAFHLAVEGGRNRTSGVTVQGVGPENREQIERVFYRAFTLLIPRNADFSMAREVTAQAARDLYGAGGAVERAVTQAWSAVGVFEEPRLTFSFSPAPVFSRFSGCGRLRPPCWSFRVTVNETAGQPLTVTRASIGFYDANERLLNTSTINFSQIFVDCGPASSRIPARGTACSDLIVTLAGRSSGYVDFLIEGRSDHGTERSFLSQLLHLRSSGFVVPTSIDAVPQFTTVHDTGSR